MTGKRTVEVNFGNLHPALIYSQEGLNPPEDSYSNIIHPRLLKHFDAAGLRATIKSSFNAMLNAKTELKAAPRGIDLKQFGLTWPVVSAAIKQAHKPIDHHFYTGVGLRLQRIDSDIAKEVMLQFPRGHLILPVHDSFVVHSGWESTVKQLMKDAFHEVTKREPTLKVTIFEGTTGDEQDDLAPISLHIDNLFPLDPDGYDRRLSAFYDSIRA